MTAEAAAVAESLDRALCDGRPEDVLGADPAKEYRRLARLVHPDVNGGDPAAADAFRKLDELWVLARALLAEGIYGAERAPTVRVKTKTRTYEFIGRIGSDDFADRFHVRWGGEVGFARVSRKPRDNDLMRAEALALKTLLRRVDPLYHPFLPSLVESVGVRQSDRVVRQANVFETADGDWYSLADVLRRYPAGIDPRDMAWMWRRLLTILGSVHRADAIHGAVLPENVLIEPTLHGLILTNWSCSVPRGGRIPAISRRHRGWYAPEVLAKKPAGRGVDIYTGARTMCSLGGSRGGSPPSMWPWPLRAFFRGCVIPNPDQRPRDAWMLLDDFDSVLERTYGPRRFRPFSMKGG